MLYVVHAFPDKAKHTFKVFKAAFTAFKAEARRDRTVALWHCDKSGKWQIVYSTHFYPQLSEPFLDLCDSNN